MIMQDQNCKQNCSAETYDPNPEILFTQTTDPKKENKRQFRKIVIIVINAIILFRIVFVNNAKEKNESGTLTLDRNHL